jgi:DMSO/TMAO reductase YedYZ molybdopterin-dependent catalytic subunit
VTTTAVSRLELATAGVATGIAGVAVSVAAAEVLRQRLTPPYAVADAIIGITPGRVSEPLIHLVGHWDKPLLVSGTLLALLVLSAGAGVLAGRNLWLGRLAFLALAGVDAAAVLTRPQATEVALLPVLLGAVTWQLVLDRLVAPALTPAATDGSRRVFLLRVGIAGAASLAVAAGGRWVGRKRRGVEEARTRLSLPVTDGSVPAGTDLGIDGLTPWQVPNDDFYRIDTALVVPAVEPAGWRLRIHGKVENELVLTFQDLLDRKLTEAWVTLCCVSNQVGGDLISNAWWSGVRVADLLAEARPLPGADAVKQTSEDGWTCGTPLAVLTDSRDAMLAVAMNGQPLPLEHGFPVRMVVPGLYGYVSATKWLVDLEVTRFDDFQAYWTDRGWSSRGPVRTQSRIDVPAANHRVVAGSMRVAGVAWAQHTGIERVEVRLDGGSWSQVQLARVPSVDTWVQWAGNVDVDPGAHTLAVRATDSSGYVQTAVRRDVIPDGATGWHTIDITAE